MFLEPIVQQLPEALDTGIQPQRIVRDAQRDSCRRLFDAVLFMVLKLFLIRETGYKLW